MRIIPTREPYEKLNVVRDPTAAIRWRAEQKQECMICGWEESYALGCVRRLEVDHVAGAAGRSDEPCNFLLVCTFCHKDKHAGKTKLDELLAAKQLCDPSNYDRKRVLQLKGRAV